MYSKFFMLLPDDMQVVDVSVDEIVQFTLSKDMVVTMMDQWAATTLGVEGLRRTKRELVEKFKKCSQTSVQRPPSGPKDRDHCWQVVVVQRSFIWLKL